MFSQQEAIGANVNIFLIRAKHIDPVSVGQVGTIEVSWSGLDLGKMYLGAVSHSDADGILAVTVINVQT